MTIIGRMLLSAGAIPFFASPILPAGVQTATAVMKDTSGKEVG